MKDVILLPHVSCKTTGNSTHVPHASTQDTHNQVPYSPLLYSVVRRLWLVICCQTMCAREHTEYFCSPVKIISHCYHHQGNVFTSCPSTSCFSQHILLSGGQHVQSSCIYVQWLNGICSSTSPLVAHLSFIFFKNHFTLH